MTDNHDGTHTITITQPEGRPAVTTIVKNGVDGQTPKVKAERDEAKKQTTLTFYIDKVAMETIQKAQIRSFKHPSLKTVKTEQQVKQDVMVKKY